MVISQTIWQKVLFPALISHLLTPNVAPLAEHDRWRGCIFGRKKIKGGKLPIIILQAHLPKHLTTKSLPLL